MSWTNPAASYSVLQRKRDVFSYIELGTRGTMPSMRCRADGPEHPPFGCDAGGLLLQSAANKHVTHWFKTISLVDQYEPPNTHGVLTFVLKKESWMLLCRWAQSCRIPEAIGEASLAEAPV